MKVKITGIIKRFSISLICAMINVFFVNGQTESNEPSRLTLERIHSEEFTEEASPKIQWIESGEAYVIIEKKGGESGPDELIRYESSSLERSVYLSADALTTSTGSIEVEGFSLSPDAAKVLIFTNASKVWRSKTKGDYWVYERSTGSLKKLGAGLESSSLMFAKFTHDGSQVYYVHKFNIYREDLNTGVIDQLTFDGTGDIINGTFDWAYEEEFGKRDGFVLSPKNGSLAFWHLDASETGTFYMINNTDSIYSEVIPIRYPKVGQEPSAAKIGVMDLKTKTTKWIPIEGGKRENYLPGIQWVSEDLILIQQMNRHQNLLTVWSYKPSNGELKKVYQETEDTFIQLNHPDVSADGWGSTDLPIVDGGKAFLRLNENDKWRHIFKVDLESGEVIRVTPFDYDVASMRVPFKQQVYFMASPTNSTQRYLYQTDLKGRGKVKRLTPENFEGMNNYNVAPNGKYALHTHESSEKVKTVRFVSLPDHRTLKVLVENREYDDLLKTLDLPEVRFLEVTTEDGIEIDARVVLPTGFEANKKFPVLFHVYGEPWGQVAKDAQIGLWNIMMAQKGYVIIDMDNRGTPCLKGSEWRKSIYRQVGRINAHDQAQAAREILKMEYLDSSRTAVWGWSGGGSMTMNLMFKYPDIYTTGVAVAGVSDQFVYDNIYQERYMGLPQENMEDFVEGSPITHAGGLEGNLLLIHGTADDNVHYQSLEMLVNKLIEEDKQFDMMAYPNRAHGIKEGENTRKHLYTLITNYLLEHVPPNE